MTIAEQLLEEGRKEGLVRGRKEGLVRGRHEGQLAALRAMLVARFGSRSLRGAHAATLRTATPRAIGRYLRRGATAETLAAVFED